MTHGMHGFRERKAERTEHYLKFVKGWRLIPCTSCNGSGYYDTNGSPPCGNCEGTGRSRCKPLDSQSLERILAIELKSSPSISQETLDHLARNQAVRPHEVLAALDRVQHAVTVDSSREPHLSERETNRPRPH